MNSDLRFQILFGGVEPNLKSEIRLNLKSEI
jgi:hypothetical protein